MEYNAKFTITINDGFYTWEYIIFIPDNNSIEKVMDKIWKGYGLEPSGGRLIEPIKNKS